tara:strand:+ start:217 stop:708 length:492 start_codon:yes stop_codon:yes gene_type:complete
MITLDICIVIFLSFWSVRGFFKGFASEVISLIVWFTAIYLTLNFFYIPVGYIQDYIVSIEISRILTFTLIFIFTFIFSMISGFLVSRLMSIIGFYSFDKLLGMLFGLIKGFAFMLLLTFFLMNTELYEHEIVSDSQFIPYFDYFLNNYLKSSDSLFDSFQLKI